MPSEARLSPRAAIETWLARAEKSADIVENLSGSFRPLQKGDAVDSDFLANKGSPRLDQHDKKGRGGVTGIRPLRPALPVVSLTISSLGGRAASEWRQQCRPR